MSIFTGWGASRLLPQVKMIDMGHRGRAEVMCHRAIEFSFPLSGERGFSPRSPDKWEKDEVDKLVGTWSLNGMGTAFGGEGSH